jgi:probable phosphoglycerate mutase
MSDFPTLTLVRHGETEWSPSDRHTGRRDIPLTDHGREQARRSGSRLADHAPALVLSSPLQRAAETARIAGFGDRMTIDPDLTEWDYGDYEGRTSAEIFDERPDWQLFRDGCPNGESPQQVAERSERVIQRVRASDGDAIVFAHRNLCRVLAARWLGLPADHGRFLIMHAAAVCVLGYDHGPDEPAVLHWNLPPDGGGA